MGDYGFVGGMLVAAAGGGVGWLVEHHYANRAADEQLAAFLAYETSLMTALTLCVRELEVVPCENAPRRKLQRIERTER